MSSSSDASPSPFVPDPQSASADAATEKALYPKVATSLFVDETASFADMVSSTISPQRLHETLWSSFVLGNQVRLRFLAALRALHKSRGYQALSCPSTKAYAKKYFHFGDSKTAEYLRVAEALLTLSELTEAFRSGRICYSILRELTRISEPNSQTKWLEFAKGKTSEQVRAEVRDALENGRKLPRDGDFGLPNVNLRMTLDLPPEKHAIVTQALELVSEAVAPRLGGEPLSSQDAFVFLAQTVLQQGLPGEDAPIRSSGHTVIYQRSVDTRRCRVQTPDGFMEVDEEVVAAVEGNAEKIDLTQETPEADSSPEPESPPSPRTKDRPNTAGLVRKVTLRDGRRCANPCCGSKEHLHCHPIVFRGDGGRTEVWNEILLCSRCHALVHARLLFIRGNPLVGLEFTTACRKLDAALEAKWKELAQIPQVETVLVSAAADARGVASAAADGGTVDGAEAHPHVVRALESIGYPRKEARKRVSSAYASRTWGPEPIHENDLFNLALRV